jgi:hypothetical protein
MADYFPVLPKVQFYNFQISEQQIDDTYLHNQKNNSNYAKFLRNFEFIPFFERNKNIKISDLLKVPKVL